MFSMPVVADYCNRLIGGHIAKDSSIGVWAFGNITSRTQRDTTVLAYKFLLGLTLSARLVHSSKIKLPSGTGLAAWPRSRTLPLNRFRA